MALNELYAENERLRQQLRESKGSEEAEEQRMRVENMKLKRKLGMPIDTREYLEARGVTVQTAREWHEGQKSE